MNCSWNAWTLWGSCQYSKGTCGNGTRKRSRSIKVHASCGGTNCRGLNNETTSCNKCCPRNCVWGSWALWGDCTKTCGSGSHVRTRNQTTEQYCGGTCAGSAKEVRECNKYTCPKHDGDCMWGFWSSWCACTKSCGGGYQSRTRHIMKEAAPGGNCIGEGKITRVCNTGCCPRDCVWAHWGYWSGCSYGTGKSCGTGLKTRSRDYAVEVYCGGKACIGQNQMNETCSSCCPSNCIWGQWQKWCHCSKSCNGGIQMRKRYIAKAESCGGVCPGVARYTRTCNMQCCPRDCVWENWNTWGHCFYGEGKLCGKGNQTRLRKYKEVEQCGGKPCTGSGKEIKECSKCCPKNCVMGEWGQWNQCSKTCGGGHQSRSRSVTEAASCGGTCEGTLRSSQSCNKKCCPSNCVWAPWQNWCPCSKTCGGGVRTRKRKKLVTESCGGQCTGDSSYSKTCNTGCCPRHCIWGTWGSWDSCFYGNGKFCGNGTRTRIRKYSQTSYCGGNNCIGSTMESKNCNKCCPRQCLWSQWSSWSKCSKSCGGGRQMKTRQVTAESACGGSCKGDSNITQACNRQCCPYDCKWRSWSTWSKCISGKISRKRQILSFQGCGGKCEGKAKEEVDCSCKAWTPWSRCDFGKTYKQCGHGGFQKRSRFCTSNVSKAEETHTTSCNAPCTIKFYTVQG